MHTTTKTAVNRVVNSVKESRRMNPSIDMGLTLSYVKSVIFTDDIPVEDRPAAVRAITARTKLEFTLEDVQSAEDTVKAAFQSVPYTPTQPKTNPEEMNMENIEQNVAAQPVETQVAAEQAQEFQAELACNEEGHGYKKYVTVRNVATVAAVVGTGLTVASEGMTVGNIIGGAVGAAVAYGVAEKLITPTENRYLDIALATSFGIGMGSLCSRIGSAVQNYVSPAMGDDGEMAGAVIDGTSFQVVDVEAA